MTPKPNAESQNRGTPYSDNVDASTLKSPYVIDSILSIVIPSPQNTASNTKYSRRNL